VQSYAVWLEFVVFLLAAAVLAPSFFLIGLVWARMLGNVAGLGATVLATRMYCGISLRSVALTIFRPLTGAAMVYPVVQTAINQIHGDVLQLGIGIACGATTFALWSAFSWLLVGRPAGFESTVFDYVQQLAKNRKQLARD
jgi:hypothetical protein